MNKQTRFFDKNLSIESQFYNYGPYPQDDVKNKNGGDS